MLLRSTYNDGHYHKDFTLQEIMIRSDHQRSYQQHFTTFFFFWGFSKQTCMARLLLIIVECFDILLYKAWDKAYIWCLAVHHYNVKIKGVKWSWHPIKWFYGLLKKPFLLFNRIFFQLCFISVKNMSEFKSWKVIKQKERNGH